MALVNGRLLMTTATLYTLECRKRRKATVMTETLKQVMEQAEQLPPELQQVVAEQFQQVLDAVMADARWEALLNDQRHKEVVRRMAQEALAEYQRGETEEGGFGG